MTTKISQDAANAFHNNKSFKRGSTEVRVFPLKDGHVTKLFLHGNVIAMQDNTGLFKVTLSGWGTQTTRDRLNALNGVKACQRAHQQYINDVPVDENEIVVISKGK